ncbi:hypothetical protein CRG98_028305 [Punica granatum]|uniref:UvrD-like helicase ATP-binding domain-containing protein n=1 Tax=Punica granatum TaxID=22663 RepID=A0A2I0J4Y5_PUNGR|nr:hypothetical protein CRG98_028305 [Punica granatum]
MAEVGQGSIDGRRGGGGGADDFMDIVFSWSLQDVEKIPERFDSVEQYLGSFIYPFLEETRAEVCSSLDAIATSPYAEVTGFEESKPHGTNLYNIKVDQWRNRLTEPGKEPYQTRPGDLLILADAKPETVSDLQRIGRFWAFAFVTGISYNDDGDDMDTNIKGGEELNAVNFKITIGEEMEEMVHKQLYVIFMVNLTTNKKTWKSLHMHGNWDILKEVLCTDSVGEEGCNLCLMQGNEDVVAGSLLSYLNESQKETALSCLYKTQCQHRHIIKLIRGPPGTGKTKTVSTMLFTLLNMKCKTLVCAPSNVAVKEVASRVQRLVRDSSLVSYGDILLFGRKDRLKMDSYTEEIYLEYRVDRIRECLAPLTGWRNCIASMITLLEDSVQQYNIFVENESVGNSNNEEEKSHNVGQRKPFIEFIRERYSSTLGPLDRCISILCIHISRSYMSKDIFDNMMGLPGHLKSFGKLLFQKDSNLFSSRLEEAFSRKATDRLSTKTPRDPLLTLYLKRCECLSALAVVQDSLNRLKLPSFMSKDLIREFCFQSATLFFCTASNTYKLHFVDMEPPKLLVIDEAAQLKECESVVPLQLAGLSHAVLVGDERQLPSIVSDEASFGRSLFERLSSLGKSKHLLDIQYRMHPSISHFPNRMFYGGQIQDAAIVKAQSYIRRYLPGSMFSPYAFINISDGREEHDDKGTSLRNLVEVAVALKLLKYLQQAWSSSSKQKLRIGIISPYAAQVGAIRARLGKKYEDSENSGGFVVNVKTVDGFQGGEEDIIIISTVRSNPQGNIGFLANCNNTNVALTRARHCLWILGNERTLRRSSLKTKQSVWEALVNDAIERQCFFNAEDDEGLAKTILEVKKEYDQLDDLLSGSSVLFRSARWKVIFSENFRQSFRKLISRQMKLSVINLLLKLSNGWRPKRRDMNMICENSLQIVKQFKVESLYVLCTVDIEKDFNYVQVLKVWDVLPSEDIPKTVKRLDGIYETYSNDYIDRCKEKSLDGLLEVPKSWQAPFNFRRSGNSSTENQEGHDLDSVLDSCSYAENSKVNDSLLLMKFYPLSSDIVNHLLSDKDGKEVELPFEVTNEEREIINFPRSTFILGRSGTGKTTILTMKLFKKEQLYQMALNRDGNGGFSDRTNNEERDEDPNTDGLHQLFVTVSPKLCFAVRRHISQLKRGKVGPIRSLALQTYVRAKEVNYEKFCTTYWPHFNEALMRKFDPSRVFTEIISHIKGGIRVVDSSNGRISREDYVLLSEGRASTLTVDEREKMYDIFLDYEKMKARNGEFDLSDLVNDLHSRLQHEKWKGDRMEFVYIDEVQDLTMRQIALFKNISSNVEEGFVFSGDTAQTIARGIDFRFEDIRFLFYKEFSHGLGDEDVLLYNFFGSSPMKNQWRVIYEYMKEQNLLDNSFPRGFPNFDLAKHNILCSELKQLYVAITRTRQRLWIVESNMEFSKPMFDYWKKLCLIQVRKLDNYLAEEMKVASTPEQWKSQGWKLMDENNYEMATMCFERAQFALGEKFARAAGLNAAADQMSISNPEEASHFRRQAGEMYESIGKNERAAQCFLALKDYERAGTLFESIGMAEFAAECFYELKEYERAGSIYLEKCGESSLERAGECFLLAGCCSQAADVYSKGNFLSQCLSACAQGNLFELGLSYIQSWKEGAKTSKPDTVKIEQDFLETCAHHYYKQKNFKMMMRFVKVFPSMEAMRSFLRSLNCLEELLSMEEEFGNFLKAADVAKLKGDTLLEARLLGKGGHFKEASMCILWYVLYSSLWGTPGSRGWPLKKFEGKKDLLRRAKSYAILVSEHFYHYAQIESTVLLDEDFSEKQILRNQVSVEAMFYFWSLWRDEIICIIDNVQCLEKQEANEYTSYVEFCLNYMGVLKLYNSKAEPIYLLLNPEAEWARNIGDGSFRRNGKLVPLELRHFVVAAKKYWGSELVSVTIKVLHCLDALYKLRSSVSVGISKPEYSQCRVLIHIYEVAEFLLTSKSLICHHSDKQVIWNFIRDSTLRYLSCVFPLDWRSSLRANIVSLRGSKASSRLLRQAFELVNPKKKLTYGQIGQLTMIILGSGKLDSPSYLKVLECFQEDTPWKILFDCLHQEKGRGSSRNVFSEVSAVQKFHEALAETFNANWRKEVDYISPSCFLYLLERLLILSSSFRPHMFTTESGFVEWLMFHEGDTMVRPNSVPYPVEPFELILEFIPYAIQLLLRNRSDTVEWIGKSGVTEREQYHRLLVLKLFMLLSLLHINFSVCGDLLCKLLTTWYISDYLPREFFNPLWRAFKHGNELEITVPAIAEAFRRVNDPLVIISWERDFSNPVPRDALCVEITKYRTSEDVLRFLFPDIAKARKHQGDALKDGAENSSSNVRPSSSNDLGENSEMGVDFDKCLSEFYQALNEHIWEAKGNFSGEEALPDTFRQNLSGMLDDLRQLHAALSFSLSDRKLEDKISAIVEISRRLQLRRPMLEHFLCHMFQERSNGAEVNPEDSRASTATRKGIENKNQGNNKSKAKKKSKRGRK